MHWFEASIQDAWISIDDLNADDITRAASMFVNLKINEINSIVITS